MQIRPARRFHPPPTPFVRPTEGVVADIINHKSSIERIPNKKFSVQNADYYVNALRKNYEEYNVPFKEPDVIESVCRYPEPVPPENYVDFLDKVYVRWNILKSGKVRLKLVPHFLIMWENYYSKGKAPPIKTIIAAYKAVGYSDAFIDKIQKNVKKRAEFMKKIAIVLEKIFDKSTTTRKKTAKPKPEPVVEKEEDEAPPEEEDDDDDDAPEEDEGFMEDEEEEVEDPAMEDVGVDDFDE